MAVLLGVVLLVLSNQWDSTTQEESSLLRRSLRLIAWMIICIGGVGWWIGVSGFVAVVLIPVVCFVLFGIGMQRYRVMENRSLVSIVIAGIERGIPPVASAVAYRQEASGLQERKADRFAKALGAGMSLVDAARIARVFLPAETVMMLELGRTMGSVDSINRHSKDFVRDDTTNYGNLDMFLGGLITVVMVGFFQLALLTFTEIKIKPVLSQIMEEFDLGASGFPVLWSWSEFSTDIILYSLYVIIPIAFVLFVLMVMVQCGVFSELPWGLRWVHGPLNECRFLNVLSVVVAADLPVQSALSVMQARFPAGRIRGVARHVYRQQQAGFDWIESLRFEGILNRGETALAKSAQDAGNLAWALKEISIGKRRRHLQRMAPAMKIVLPILVMLAALPVLFAAIGIFLPIINLVTNLSL
ncbi:type II secretion system F family protein [Bremerella sp.]|uniref:type II secretion system F family protein n=1 Tax=Bremerella sp. TaxID=2795602 RepID=UPI0039190996